MGNIYKYKKSILLFNLLIYMLAGVMIGMLVWQFAKSIIISLGFGILLFLLVSISSILSAVMKVEFNNKEIILYERNKKKIYNRDGTEFKFRMSNLNYILVIEIDDEIHYYDCSLLGKKQFFELLNKLKINRGV